MTREEISWTRYNHELQKAMAFYRLIGMVHEIAERCARGELERRFKLEPAGG